MKKFWQKTYLDILPPLNGEAKEGATKIIRNQANNFNQFKNFGKKLLLNKITLIVFIVVIASGGFYYSRHQVLAPIFFSPLEVKAVNEEERAKLEKELAEIEAQIAQHEKELKTTQTEKQTLQNEIDKLKSRAKQISLQIQSSQVSLNQIKTRIEDTQEAIEQTLSNLEKTKKELATLLQAFYQKKQESPIEILLANKNFSDYFDETNNLNIIQTKIQAKLQDLKELQNTLTEQKAILDDRKDETQKLLSMQLLQQQELEKTKKSQETLLDVTKGKEANYQKLLSEARQKAAEIRSRIYELVGVKSEVTFGEALDIANWVSAKLGIRPAFLLAIITQESNLGKNVGTCNRPGDPPNKSWKVVMKPDRDQNPFLQITQKLGMDPDSTPVSCPMYQNGQRVGWGGAMGPAQFLPSTWLAYENKVSSITGKSPANPWDVRDAFVAAALYLVNYGAASQKYEDEWKAAMIYFSGSTNTKFRFYGDNVMAIATRYQADIDAINKAK